MNYYDECPHCGASLDPGERCDCQLHKRLKIEQANRESAEPIYHADGRRVEEWER